MAADVSEVRQLSADLRMVPKRLHHRIEPVVERGANNIKRQIRADFQNSRHFSGVARSVAYDMRLASFGEGVIEAEIGPSAEPGSPGNLANVAIFGTSRGGGGNVADPRLALEAEAPRYIKALTDLLEDIL